MSTPGFLSPDDAYYAVHRNPRNTVFARHNRIGVTVHYLLQAIIVLQYIDHKDQVLTQIHAAENRNVVASICSTGNCLTVGDAPSYRSCLAVHHLRTPPRSLAI